MRFRDGEKGGGGGGREEKGRCFAGRYVHARVSKFGLDFV